MGIQDDIIQSAVDKFLGWQLPEDFNPDCGISFEKFHSHNGPNGVQQYKPVGTNLLTAEQARAMFEHCLGDRINKIEAQLALAQTDAERYRRLRQEHDSDDPLYRVYAKTFLNRSGLIELSDADELDSALDSLGAE